MTNQDKLISGAKTIVDQCLNVDPTERVAVMHDNNDPDLIDAVVRILKEKNAQHRIVEYEEPDNHGQEPPKDAHQAMVESDVVIAPTKKSLSHTKARKQACKSGARVATLPGVNKRVWSSSLQADYAKVEQITNRVYSILEETKEVKITTPSGTNLEFKVDFSTYHADTGIIHEEGEFGNLPAGEPNGFPVEISGSLVIDHFPFAPEGTQIKIEDGEVVDLSHPKGVDSSQLELTFKNKPKVRKIAEFGFGTNPQADLIGNVLQDEKVLGTVHIAFGDNCSYLPEGDQRRNPCEIHWDTICKGPTVYFNDKLMLDQGEPIFLR